MIFHIFVSVLETVVEITTTIDRIAKAVIEDERREDIQALSISDLVPSPLDSTDERIQLDEKLVEDQEFKSGGYMFIRCRILINFIQ